MNNDINIYKNSSIILERRTPKKVISWITILILFFIFLIIISFIPINIYKAYNGYVSVDNENQYINIILNSDNLINKKGVLYIKKTRLNYEVISERDNIITMLVNSDYVLLQNKIIQVNLLQKKATLLEFLRNKMMKGFDS